MANKYHALISQDNLVLQVIVTRPKCFPTHYNRFPGTWVECFREGGERVNYPGIGWVYNPQDDVFMQPEPANSENYVFNNTTYLWDYVGE